MFVNASYVVQMVTTTIDTNRTGGTSSSSSSADNATTSSSTNSNNSSRTSTSTSNRSGIINSGTNRMNDTTLPTLKQSLIGHDDDNEKYYKELTKNQRRDVYDSVTNTTKSTTITKSATTTSSSSSIVGTRQEHKLKIGEQRLQRILYYNFEPNHKWWEPPIQAWLPDTNREIFAMLVVYNITITLLAKYTSFCGIPPTTTGNDDDEDDEDYEGGGSGGSGSSSFCNDEWMLNENHIITGLAVGLFLLLAFRANNSYARFWEGRKAWGRIKEISRDLTRQVCFQITLGRRNTNNASSSNIVGRTQQQQRSSRRGGATPPPPTEVNEGIEHPLSSHPMMSSTSNEDDDGGNVTGSIIDDDEEYIMDYNERKRCIGFIAAFSATLKVTMRNESNIVPELGGILCFQDILNIEKCRHMPQFCLDVITYYLMKQVQNGKLSIHEYNTMNETCLTVLADSLGTCERIRKTPIPLSYALQLRFFLIFWLCLYPLHIVGYNYGYYTILLASIVDWAVLGIESMACEIENPFGYHKNCIDLCSFCKGIVADIYDILSRVEHPMSNQLFDYETVKTMNEELFAVQKQQEQCGGNGPYDKTDKTVEVTDDDDEGTGNYQLKGNQKLIQESLDFISECEKKR